MLIIVEVTAIWKPVKIGKFHILELIISGFMDFWVYVITYNTNIIYGIYVTMFGDLEY